MESPGFLFAFFPQPPIHFSLFGAIMPLGGATNKAQRSVVDKKGKGKGKGGGDDFDEDNAFKAKQKADAAALKAMVCYL